MNTIMLGISHEATNTHDTTEICLSEINNVRIIIIIYKI